MKARRFARTPAIHPYLVGDLLLEADRATSNGPVLLQTLGGNLSLPEPTAESIVDILKPAADDYPALVKTLQVLKFSKEDVAKYHEAIGSIVTMASSVVWMYGAVLSVASFIGDLLGDDEDAVDKKLDHISQRVDQIYGYLAAQERRGLHTQASAWRRDLTQARRAVQRARASRSPQNLEELREMARTCGGNLLDMLDPGSGDIAFLRGVYGWKPSNGQGGHWVEGAVSPYMNLSSGATIDYRSPSRELQATIWDPGHYIDVLVQALNDYLLLSSALEPAYRTTGYRLGDLKDIANGLMKFLNHWRSHMIVANPLAGLNGGGELLHPIMDAPFGVIIGAADPVSGVAFHDMWWADFTLVSIWEASAEAKGAPDETRAKDPALALARALDLQPRLVRGTIAASGIGKLADLVVRLQAILARSTIESDFVDLPNANFDRLTVSGPSASQPVDLGFIGSYSKNPGKKYSTERYSQTFTKTFKFAMPLRGEMSLIQPGYRMEVGRESITVIPFGNAPADGSPVTRFPTQPITKTISGDDWTVYDVYQSQVFSEADEDRYEGADPQAGLGRFRAEMVEQSPYINALNGSKASPWVDIEVLRPKQKPERLFLNERRGYASLKVDITFDADLNDPDYPFAGYATVTISNLDSERFRDGLILPITVYETRVDAEGQREECMADRMTIHMVPGFYVVEASYFSDRREGLEAIDTIFGGINERYVRVRPDLPIGPEWRARRQVLVDDAKVESLQRFLREEGAEAERVLQRFRVPDVRG